MSIGERIKRVRALTGLSQTEFGGRAGLTRPQIASFELERVRPSEPVLRTIAGTYSVNLDWLRTGEGEMDGNSESVPHRPDAERETLGLISDLLSGRATPEAKQLVQLIASCTDDELRTVVRLAERLVRASDTETEQ